MLRFSLSSKLDQGSCIASIAKTAPKETGTLICSIEVLLSVSINLPYGLACDISVICELVLQLLLGCMLNKLQKWVCRTFDHLTAASLETLVHHQNIGSLSFLFRLVDVHLNCLSLN